jgi:hypothetical protein
LGGKLAERDESTIPMRLTRKTIGQSSVVY